MYLDRMITVGKIENGYIIEVTVPYKEGSTDLCCPSSEEKQFHVATAEEAGEKISALLPALEDKMDAEEAFAHTFEKAVKDE